MEIMWLREYVHNDENITQDDTEASREKKIAKNLARANREGKSNHSGQSGNNR